MRNLKFYENSGNVLCFNYSNELLYNIEIYSSEFIDNVESL